MALNLGGLFRQSSVSLPTKALGSGSNTVFDLLNPSNARNAISGLKPGGGSSSEKSVPNIGFQSAGADGGASAASEDDWRVRVSLAPGAKIFYQDPSLLPNALMHPLLETNGVIWPYTPSISVTHSAQYSSTYLTHSNYPAHFYNSSEVADINISGDFTVQGTADGQYLMAAVYFFRAATKMFFGQGDNVGNPPPVVFLDGYGSHYFPHVPCVITNFTHTLPNEVDYMQVPIYRTKLEESQIAAPTETNDVNPYFADSPRPNWGFTGSTAGDAKLAANNSKANTTKTEYKTITTTTRVPTISTISVTLRPIYSRKSLHDRFDLNKFSQGELLANRDTGAGGFI